MSVPYDIFVDAFLQKVSEFELLQMEEADRTEVVDGYLKRAVAGFRKNCKYNLVGTSDDIVRVFFIDIPEEDIDEIADIVSEGMLIQWLKPYTYKQELYETILNTRDFTTNSPAELLKQVGSKYNESLKNYKQMIREYSYNHGDLSDLHT